MQTAVRVWGTVLAWTIVRGGEPRWLEVMGYLVWEDGPFLRERIEGQVELNARPCHGRVGLCNDHDGEVLCKAKYKFAVFHAVMID